MTFKLVAVDEASFTVFCRSTSLFSSESSYVGLTNVHQDLNNHISGSNVPLQCDSWRVS